MWGGRKKGQKNLHKKGIFKKCLICGKDFYVPLSHKECKFCGRKCYWEYRKKHPFDYNKKNNNLFNLISLCKSCHGQTNFDRDDWSIYFKKKSKKRSISKCLRPK
jgi:5-methylcytosine-specific restriction endonuclease McrA